MLKQKIRWNTFICLFVYLFLPLAEEFGGIPSRKIRV